jgi:hypothetical protein
MSDNAKQRLLELWPRFEYYVREVLHSNAMPFKIGDFNTWIDFCAWYTEQSANLDNNKPEMPGPLKDALVGGPDD